MRSIHTSSKSPRGGGPTLPLDTGNPPNNPPVVSGMKLSAVVPP